MSNCDDITRRFFELERWQRALDTAVDKRINRALLREMAKPETRIALYYAIVQRRYSISPPRAVLIPKDNHGNYRMVYVNDPADRVILAITNELFFNLTPDCLHPASKSYVTGIGTGQVVIEASRHMAAMSCQHDVVGWKADLSKYFDSVPIELIDRAFDMLEQRYGQSALVDMVRRYYHDNRYIDIDGKQACKFMSLRQGCAVSAWLADVLLCHVDERLSRMRGYYVRYSDDMLYIGPDHQQSMDVLMHELSQLSLSLNPDKVENLCGDRWFTFLGYSICGAQISLSPSRIKRFQRAIDRVTGTARDMAQAINRVNRLLHHGRDDHSWARMVLPVINCQRDIGTLNAYVMDAIRAAHTGHCRIGGLGYNPQGIDHCIERGRGRHVASNLARTPRWLDGYYTLRCMRKALKTSWAAYDTIVRQL